MIKINLKKFYCMCGCGIQVKFGNNFIHGHHNKVRTKETTEKIRKSIKQVWQDFNYRTKQVKAHIGKKQSKEQIQKRVEKLRGHIKYCCENNKKFNVWTETGLGLA